MPADPARALLVRARKALRPPPPSRADWEALRARLEDEHDLPDLPTVPPMDRKLPITHIAIATTLAIAATVLLWLAVRPTPVTTAETKDPNLAPAMKERNPSGWSGRSGRRGRSGPKRGERNERRRSGGERSERRRSRGGRSGGARSGRRGRSGGEWSERRRSGGERSGRRGRSGGGRSERSRRRGRSCGGRSERRRSGGERSEWRAKRGAHGASRGEAGARGASGAGHSAGDLGAELRLTRGAKGALERGDARGALRRVRVHARRFPEGVACGGAGGAGGAGVVCSWAGG